MVIDFFWIWAGRVDKCADHEGDCSENSFHGYPWGLPMLNIRFVISDYADHASRTMLASECIGGHAPSSVNPIE